MMEDVQFYAMMGVEILGYVLAVAAIVDDLFAHQSALTVRVLESEGDESAAVDAWIASRNLVVDRVEQLLAELRAQPAVDLAMLAVANRQLRGLIAG